MDKIRIHEIEQKLKDYFLAYNCLAVAPSEVVQEMKRANVAFSNTTEKLVAKSLMTIAEIEPYIENLCLSEIELLTGLYDTDKPMKTQAEIIASERDITVRTVYRMRFDLLEKIDKAMSAALSQPKRGDPFQKRWQ